MTSERIELQGQGRPRREGELGAFAFQRWLEKWRGRDDVRVKIALDGSHAIAEPRK